MEKKMRFSLRKALMLLVLSVAVSSPVMAKDSPSLSKSKTSTAEGKTQYKRTTVNINKANAAALSAYLVGVGPVKAKAIVAYRSKNGKFSNIKDIMKVEGVGEGVFKGLKKNISTSRGETSAPKGYKMGSATAKKKSTTRKKSTSSKSTTSKSKSSSSSSKTKAKKSSSSTSDKKAKKTKSKSSKSKDSKKKSKKKSTKSSKDKKKKKSKKKSKK
jgi:competence protein ComEA